jgi:ABC-type polysaccharide/polyol phosphate export permease
MTAAAAVHRVHLVRHLVRRDFRLRYHGSTLGIAWSLALPLAQLLVLVFLFQRVVPLGIEAYPAFVFSALLPWTWFSTCVGGAGSLFIGNRDLVRRPDFAPLTIVLVSTLANLLGYLLSLPILVLVCAAYHRALAPAVLVLPLLLLIEGVLILGVSLVVATLNVFYRDVQHIVGVALTLLFYLTPVFYRGHEAGSAYQLLFTLSPIAVLVQAHRAIFFHGEVPALGPLLGAAMTSSLVCAAGWLLFRRQEHDIVDVI